MYTTEEIIERFRLVHGDKYNYSKVNFVKTTVKVPIICQEHGEFWQEPHAHLKGQGCPTCAIKKRIIKKTNTVEYFITKAKEKYGDTYDYSLVDYINNKVKVKVICPKHGVFEISPGSHIGANGRGCPKCGNSKKGNTRKIGVERFINRANEIHKYTYDYSKVEYINYKTNIMVICPQHGEFEIATDAHLRGQGCPICLKEKRVEKNIANHTLNTNNSETSKHKDELTNYIASLIGYENIVIGNNDTDPDILIPTKNIAFDLDSLFWNCEMNKPNKNYHLNKTNFCEANNIQLIHIFEDEWLNKKDICKSRIKNLLGYSNKIFARKCSIVEIDKTVSKKFFDDNHIQGNVSAPITYGLEYNGEIVAAMSFGGLRKNLGSTATEGSYELLRFSNKMGFNVVGGASRLFKHFIKTHSPINITSYADRRWSMGNLYEKLNFRFSHLSEPSYFYIIGNERKNRFGFRKNILIERYGCLPTDTEHNFCFNKGWYRIYDCGTKVYKWENKKAIS